MQQVHNLKLYGHEPVLMLVQKIHERLLNQTII